MLKIKPETKPSAKRGDWPRVAIPIPPDLLAKIDKEWHKRELPSRTEAMHELWREALAK